MWSVSPRYGIRSPGGVEAHVSMERAPTEEEQAALGQLAEAAAARMKLIDTCHERVACPKCGAPVGERCHKLSSRPARDAPLAMRERSSPTPPVEAKNPHEERWRQEVPPR